MFSTLPLFVSLRDAFIEACGEPNRTLDNTIHWALNPNDNSAAVHVLICTDRDAVQLWVFDARHPTESFYRGIESEGDIEYAVAQVKRRVNGVHNPQTQSFSAAG